MIGQAAGWRMACLSLAVGALTGPLMIPAAHAADLSTGPFGLACTITRACDGALCAGNPSGPVNLTVPGRIPGAASLAGAEINSTGEVIRAEQGGLSYLGNDAWSIHILNLGPDMQAELVRDYGDGTIVRTAGRCELHR